VKQRHKVLDEIDAEKHGVDPRDKLKHDIGGRERERERERER